MARLFAIHGRRCLAVPRRDLHVSDETWLPLPGLGWQLCNVEAIEEPLIVSDAPQGASTY